LFSSLFLLLLLKTNPDPPFEILERLMKRKHTACRQGMERESETKKKRRAEVEGEEKQFLCHCPSRAIGLRPSMEQEGFRFVCPSYSNRERERREFKRKAMKGNSVTCADGFGS
jgi:hypothetical protein